LVAGARLRAGVGQLLPFEIPVKTFVSAPHNILAAMRQKPNNQDGDANQETSRKLSHE
jgi:hypothetical protein